MLLSLFPAKANMLHPCLLFIQTMRDARFKWRRKRWLRAEVFLIFFKGNRAILLKLDVSKSLDFRGTCDGHPHHMARAILEESTTSSLLCILGLDRNVNNLVTRHDIRFSQFYLIMCELLSSFFFEPVPMQFDP